MKSLVLFAVVIAVVVPILEAYYVRVPLSSSDEDCTTCTSTQPTTTTTKRSKGRRIKKTTWKKSDCPTACCSPPGYASVFIAHDVDTDTSTAGSIPANLTASCPACASGTQYSYKAISPAHDFDEITDTKGLVVGRFSCANSQDLCVETTMGLRYQGVAGSKLYVEPVPYCQNDRCKMFLALTADTVSDLKNAALKLYTSEVYMTPEDQFRTLGEPENMNSLLRWRFEDFPYQSIAGIACNRCESPIQYCDRSILYKQN